MTRIYTWGCYSFRVSETLSTGNVWISTNIRYKIKWQSVTLCYLNNLFHNKRPKFGKISKKTVTEHGQHTASWCFWGSNWLKIDCKTLAIQLTEWNGNRTTPNTDANTDVLVFSDGKCDRLCVECCLDPSRFIRLLIGFTGFSHEILLISSQ